MATDTTSGSSLPQPPLDATPIGVYHRQDERQPSSVPVSMFSTEELRDLAVDWKDKKGKPIYQRIELPPDAKIVVAGAYTGRVMALLHEAFPDAHIVGYEPQLWAYNEAAQRMRSYQPQDFPDGMFPGTGRWGLHNYGIAVAEQDNVPMYGFGTDSCSIHPESTGHPEQAGHGSFKEFGWAMKQQYGDDWRIDLLILNMEGYEFELMPHLLGDPNLCCRIGALAVQFHLFAANLTTRLLAGTTYQYGPARVDHFPQWVLWQYKTEGGRLA